MPAEPPLPDSAELDNQHAQRRAGIARRQRSALAAELLRNREAILLSWRNAGENGESSIASSLSRVQFNDHIPAVLDCLAHTIEGWPDGCRRRGGQ